jgi:hypothetical protein
MSSQSDKALKYKWRDAIKSEMGPRYPLIRLVLLVMSDWMNKERAECSPAISVLAEQTALSESAVRERLQQADGVWFRRRKVGRQYVYYPLIPNGRVELPSVTELRLSKKTAATAAVSVERNTAATESDTAAMAALNTAATAAPTHLHMYTHGDGVSALDGRALTHRREKLSCIRCGAEMLDPCLGPYCRDHVPSEKLAFREGGVR